MKARMGFLLSGLFALVLHLEVHGEPLPPAPEIPKFGKPGETIHTSAVALKQVKKSADRAEGGANHVLFTLWIPEGLEKVRGIYHTPFNLDTVEKDHSRAMARNWGFAIVGGNFMRVQRSEMGPSLLSGLQELATKSGHPELAGAPLLLASMSAGTGMCLAIAEQMPERVIACGLVCLEVGPETARTRDVPMLTIFGERDGRQMEQLAVLLPKRRADFGASWAIAPQWGRKHEWGQANHLLWTFFDEVMRQRLPAQAGGSLNPCDPARAWLGDPATWLERNPVIAPAGQFPGEPKAACWFPGQETAHVWQAFVVNRPLIRIVSPATQGDGKPLPIFAPTEEIVVRVECAATLSAKKLALYDRQTRLAEADVVGGKCEFRAGKLPPGIHTFIVRGVGDGGAVEISRPTTILVQHPVSQPAAPPTSKP